MPMEFVDSPVTLKYAPCVFRSVEPIRTCKYVENRFAVLFRLFGRNLKRISCNSEHFTGLTRNIGYFAASAANGMIFPGGDIGTVLVVFSEFTV